MSNNVTLLLEKWQQGNQTALSELIPIVYDELHRLASYYLQAERSNHTLQTTALINEAFIHLIEDNKSFANRSHFIAVAANTMRRVLIDYARKKNAQKRERDAFKITLAGIAESIMAQDVDFLALEQALTKLEIIDPVQVKIVELRFFCGLTIEETANILEISPTSVKNDWAMAKAWLHRELS